MAISQPFGVESFSHLPQGSSWSRWPRPPRSGRGRGHCTGTPASRAGGEIAAAGLLGGHGVILGRLGRRYLMLAGQQGVALAAPPRAGKGVGVVIPNLLNWPDSVIVTDVKKENWAITAGYRRSRGHIVHLFDPLSPRTARWNPFTYVSAQPELRIDGVQKIADMFYTEIPGTDPVLDCQRPVALPRNRAVSPRDSEPSAHYRRGEKAGHGE